MKEDLELVTDFGSLKAGMIVVVTYCGGCAGGHRGMLTKTKAVTAGYGEDGARGWFALPSIHVDRAITPGAVARGIVFRVIDNLDLRADNDALIEDIDRLCRLVAP